MQFLALRGFCPFLGLYRRFGFCCNVVAAIVGISRAACKGNIAYRVHIAAYFVAGCMGRITTRFCWWRTTHQTTSNTWMVFHQCCYCGKRTLCPECLLMIGACVWKWGNSSIIQHPYCSAHVVTMLLFNMLFQSAAKHKMRSLYYYVSHIKAAMLALWKKVSPFVLNYSE